MEAPDGYTALQFIAGQRPDLVLLDLRMPLLRGEGVARVLREQAWTIRPKILVISGDLGALGAAGLAMDADAYIPKPFDVEAVAQKVTDLRSRSSRASVADGAAMSQLALGMTTQSLQQSPALPRTVHGCSFRGPPIA
jgi:DNA-binding response OmpR family regulator